MFPKAASTRSKAQIIYMPSRPHPPGPGAGDAPLSNERGARVEGRGMRVRGWEGGSVRGVRWVILPNAQIRGSIYDAVTPDTRDTD